jgi:sulfide:quinone oxidoreductase
MRRVLILGGGFGGVSAAHHLRELLDDEDEILLIDRRRHFSVGFRKTWALLDFSTMEEGQRALKGLENWGIKVLHETITDIDPINLSAQVGDKPIQADAMVIALGAEHALDAIPGYREYGLNPYDPASVTQTREKISAYDGGKVVIGICGVPYTCPPAPYEIAILLQEQLKDRGHSPEMALFTPLPMSLPILGEAGCSVIEGRLADQGIEFLPNRHVTRIDKGEIIFAIGRLSYDLFLGIPPHRCPEIVVQAGLAAEGGWVEVNPSTLETAFPGVYAVGDLTTIPLANEKRLPKAGVFAEQGARVVAEHVHARFQGSQSEVKLEAHGACFFEVGGGEAMLVEGHFLAEPTPDVALTAPSTKYLEEKRMFESDRLRRWFGK